MFYTSYGSLYFRRSGLCTNANIDSSDIKIRRSLIIKLSIPQLEHWVLWLNIKISRCILTLTLLWYHVLIEKKQTNLNEKCAGFVSESRAATAPKHLNDLLGQQGLSIVEEQLMHHFLLWSCFTNALWWVYRSRVFFFSDIWYFLSMSTYYQHKKTRLQFLTPFFPYNFKMIQYVMLLHVKHSFNVNQSLL